MKSTFSPILGSFILASLILSACGNSEEAVPQMKVAEAPKPAVKEVPPPPEDEPELVPIQSLSAKKTEPAPAVLPVNAPATDARPLDEGEFVIQVRILPSKKAANNIVKALASNGIKAYTTEVESPGELEGTYYRVRIGYFASIKTAQEYAKQALTPLGYSWWVDNSSNDAVGNPSSESVNSTYEDTQTYEPVEPAPVQEQAPVQEVQPAPAPEPPAPAPTPEPVPEPEPAPTPVQETPAPEPQPAPAPAPVQDADLAPGEYVEEVIEEVVDDWE